MISIKNRQRKIPVDLDMLERQAQKILEIVGCPDFDLGILLTNNKTIRYYNRTYRNKDKATDILSFSYHSDIEAGKKIHVLSDEDKNLGDLIISLEYVVGEAKKYNVTLEERLRILLVHGVCHLLGYDHEDDDDWRRMRAKEAYILKKLHAEYGA